jgi:hypothetical protein
MLTDLTNRLLIYLIDRLLTDVIDLTDRLLTEIIHRLHFDKSQLAG